MHVEHHLEQRIAAQVTLSPEGGDDSIERRKRMLLSFQEHVLRPFQHVQKGRLAGNLTAENDVGDNHAEELFQLPRAPVGDRTANQHNILARVAVQQRAERGQQKAVEGGLLLATQDPDESAQP